MNLDMHTCVVKPKNSTIIFQPSNWKYILKLLGLIIVADKKTLKEEVDTFLDAVTELRAIIDPSICFTEKMAMDWFKLNKGELEEIIEGLAYDTALCEILAPIKSMPHKLDIISCMVRIAVSDGEYCDAEKGFIKKTCLYWNIRSDFQEHLEHLHKPYESPRLVEYLKDHPTYRSVLKTYE
jgi:hypothetical protein